MKFALNQMIIIKRYLKFQIWTFNYITPYSSLGILFSIVGSVMVLVGFDAELVLPLIVCELCSGISSFCKFKTLFSKDFKFTKSSWFKPVVKNGAKKLYPSVANFVAFSPYSL